MDKKLQKTIAAFSQNRTRVIMAVGIAGILLIAFARLPRTQAKQTAAAVDTAQSQTKSYEQELEQRLELILGSMTGVGRVRVMVTLENGYGYEYAKQNKTNSDRLDDVRAEEAQKTQEKNTVEESYVMVDATGGGKQPLVTRELEPMVKGVVVVCDGGGDAATAAAVIETVRVAANVSSTQIAVAKMVSAHVEQPIQQSTPSTGIN